MKTTIKLTIAGLVAALATTMGMATPAHAGPPAAPQRLLECC